jgi:4-amino-4-deoxy-L-arabinose transferase-like glycosyltransferase
VVFGFTPSDSFMMVDSFEYLEAAKRLVNEGVYSSKIRLPGYPVLLSGLMLLTDNLRLATVLFQVILAFVAGLLAAKLAEGIRSNTGILTLLLACFNPVTIFYVQAMLSDMLFAFLFMVHLYFLVKVIKIQSDWAALITGVTAGLAAVVRLNGQFLILTMLLIILLSHRFHEQCKHLTKTPRIIVIALLGSLVVVSPWLHSNWKEGNGISFSSLAYRNMVIHENVISAVAHSKGVSRARSRELVYNSVIGHAKIPSENWNTVGLLDRQLLVARYAFVIMEEICGFHIVRGIMRALTIFFLVSDGRGWSLAFQQDVKERLKFDDYQKKPSQYSLTAVWRGDPLVSKKTFFIHVLTIGFTVIIRLFNLFGISYLVRNKKWSILLIFALYSMIFVGTGGFLGYSRFRLPLEPLLVILASLGALEARLWAKKFKNQRIR